ncbi:hypothetical protein D7D25_08400 [Proteiniphilum sp. X52]|nr:hypothetical protein D7D25_08400 [Proteiniphilum sp. X52]
MILFAYSCNTSRQMPVSQPVAINMQTQDTIPHKSISLQKGKICYLTTTSYDYVLPDMDIFELNSSSDFITSSSQSPLSGSASDSYQTDTVLRSQFLVRTALEKVAENSSLGSEFIYYHTKELKRDKKDLDSIIKSFNPDYIIILNKLEFRVNGNVFRNASIASSKYSTGDFYVTTSEPIFTYTGNILITYDALWNIKHLKDDQQTEISQKGEVHANFFKNYNIIEHLVSTARQAGNDFLTLLKE